MLSSSKLVGSSPELGRVENDFYATAPIDTRNFLNQLSSDYECSKEKVLTILEPAAGAGHIIDVLKEFYPDAYIHGSDIISRRSDIIGETNFLTSEFDNFDLVITNPPFSLAKEFIDKSFLISNRYVIMFARLVFLEGTTRQKWFKSLPLKYVYVYSYRATPYRNGEKFDSNGKKWANTVAYAWYVFDKTYFGEPKIRWIGK